MEETDVKRATTIKDPSTLPEDIYHILDSDTDHEVAEENVEWAGEAFKALLRSRFTKREERRGERTIYFSSLGKKDRQAWYKANKPEVAEKLHPKQNMKFLYGDVLELLMLFLAKESGHEVTHEQHRVELDGIGGYTDALIDGVPVDCKSASSYSFQKFKEGTFVFEDPFGYIPQLSGYAHALGKTDRAGFLVNDKVHGDICFAEIDKLTIEGNPPEPRIAHLREIVNSETRPPRCYPDEPEGKSGNRKLGLNCAYCEFKEDCWDDANGGKGLRKFFYSRGPVWLTEVAKEPRVDESPSSL
jgi:hypothetical protein